MHSCCSIIKWLFSHYQHIYVVNLNSAVGTGYINLILMSWLGVMVPSPNDRSPHSAPGYVQIRIWGSKMFQTSYKLSPKASSFRNCRHGNTGVSGWSRPLRQVPGIQEPHCIVTFDILLLRVFIIVLVCVLFQGQGVGPFWDWWKLQHPSPR